MIFTCRKCENDFLTEADLHIVIPTNNGTLLECGCRYQQEITKLKNALDVCMNLINELGIAYNMNLKMGIKLIEAQKQIQDIMEG